VSLAEGRNGDAGLTQLSLKGSTWIQHDDQDAVPGALQPPREQHHLTLRSSNLKGADEKKHPHKLPLLSELSLAPAASRATLFHALSYHAVPHRHYAVDPESLRHLKRAPTEGSAPFLICHQAIHRRC
jgi:hypothetical protein